MFGSVLQLETLVVKIVADATQFDSVMMGVERRMQNMGMNLATYGLRMAAALAVPLAAMEGIVIRHFARFDDAMTRSMAIMGDLPEGARPVMEQKVFEVSSNSLSSPTDLAKAYYDLASAGFTAAQSVAALDRVNRFAVAGQMDLQTATIQLTTSQNALGLRMQDPVKNMEQLTRISDVLTSANNNAVGTTKDFAAALARVAPVMRLSGISLEEGVSALMVYANQGIRGAEAGTRLGIALRMIQIESIRFKPVWDALGVSVYDTAGRMNSFQSILGQLDEKMRGMSTETKRRTLIDLGLPSRSVDALLPFIGLMGEFRNNLDELQRSAGTTDQVFDKIMQSFLSQWTKTKNQLSAVMIEVGAVAAKSIQPLFEPIQQAVAWWSSLNSSVRTVIITVGVAVVTFVVLAAVLAGIVYLGSVLVTIFGLVWTAISTVGGAVVGVIGWALGWVFSWVGLVIAALGLLIWWLVGTDGLAAAWDDVKAWAGDASMKIIGFLYNIVDNFKILTEWIRNNWRGVMHDIVEIMKVVPLRLIDVLIALVENVFGEVFQWVLDHFDALTDDLMTIWRVFGEFVIKNGIVAAEGLIRVFSVFAGWLMGALPKAFEFALGAMMLLAAAGGALILKALVTGKGLNELLAEEMKKAFGELGDQIPKDMVAGWRMATVKGDGNMGEKLREIFEAEKKKMQPLDFSGVQWRMKAEDFETLRKNIIEAYNKAMRETPKLMEGVPLEALDKLPQFKTDLPDNKALNKLLDDLMKPVAPPGMTGEDVTLPDIGAGAVKAHDFKQMNLSRFVMQGGPGSNPWLTEKETKGMEVHAPGVEKKLEDLRKAVEDQKHPVTK